MNNYNTSTSGISIETNICYDQDMSQINFDENIERIEKDLFLYTFYNQLATSISFDNLTISDDYRTILVKTLGEYSSVNITDFETIDILKELLYYWNGKTAESYLSLIDLSKELEIETNIDDIYKLISIRGYSQGDYAEVLINFPEYQKLTGCNEWSDTMEQSFKDDLTNLFYDSPMICRATVNDEEIYIELYDGMYNNYLTETAYDSDKVIDYVCNYLKDDTTINQVILRAKLNELIPTEMEY